MLCENMLFFLFNRLKYVNYFDFLDIEIFITFIIKYSFKKGPFLFIINSVQNTNKHKLIYNIM